MSLSHLYEGKCLASHAIGEQHATNQPSFPFSLFIHSHHIVLSTLKLQPSDLGSIECPFRKKEKTCLGYHSSFIIFPTCSFYMRFINYGSHDQNQYVTYKALHRNS